MDQSWGDTVNGGLIVMVALMALPVCVILYALFRKGR